MTESRSLNFRFTPVQNEDPFHQRTIMPQVGVIHLEATTQPLCIQCTSDQM